jgi:hypothetical protein
MSVTMQVQRKPETSVEQLLRCGNPTEKLPECSGKEAVVSSSSEYIMNKKADLNGFKIEQTYSVSSRNMAMELFQ